MKDVLIVGFGLAGVCVAKQLELRGKTFDVISDESQTSSKVAGGVLNPVALKRYNLAWNAQKLMPEAIQFYRKFNASYSESVFKPVPVFKLFSSIEDQNNWVVASDQPKLEAFLNSQIQSLQQAVTANFKAGQVLQSHLLDIKALLNSEKQRYEQLSQFFSQSFNHNDIKFSNNSLTYQGRTYRFVVFCEGFGVRKNPYFNWLPLYGNKGEYLVFKSKDLKSNQLILKSRHFIIPMGKDIYKYGATYSREHLDNTSTPQAKVDLETKLAEMLDCEFEIIDQLAGVRPTVRDRKPIIGEHPEFKNCFILNGFGSRGVMAAPMLSRRLIEFIMENTDIEKEINLSRFLMHFE